MLKKIFTYGLLIGLAFTLYYNPNFKTISAGVAILIFGMIMLEEGFKAFTKGPLQNMLKKATDKLYKSISVGALVTALIQSSSLVSVITISFISAGLISLAGGLGLIFGANIGSTATAWLVAGFGLKIKISTLAMPMIIFGLIFSFQKKTSIKGIGNVLAGLGFFFLGIYFMKEGFDVFSKDIDLTQYAVSGFKGVLIYTGIGIIITVVLQSSAASLVLVLTALAAGQIEYENALALAIGANVGTTITAVLGSISSNVSGKRLAGAHLIFNVVTGVIALALIYPLADLVNKIAELINIAATDYTLKLALFHTIFNIIGVIVMIPFIKKLEEVLIKFFKEKVDLGIEEPKYLNESSLNYPQTAIRTLLNESKRLFEKAIFEIVSHSLNLHTTDIKGNEKLKKIVKKSKETIEVDIEDLYTHKVKTIYSKIIKYATLAQSKFPLSGGAAEAFTRIKLANRNLVEIVKDIRGLRINVLKYMNSDNEYIHKEYDRLRKKVSRVLREVYQTRKDEQPQAHLERLEKLKRKAMESDALLDGSLDGLIREKKISSAMATSLANDSNIVARISQKMIETAQLLYIDSYTLIKLVEEDTTGEEEGGAYFKT